MTDLCSLEGAIHDIRRSNQILEVLVSSMIQQIRVMKKYAKVPEGLASDELLLDFEIMRQQGHCAEAETILAAMQNREPDQQSDARTFYRSMTHDDLAPGVMIMIGGQDYMITASLIGPDWWDCWQDREMMISFPADQILAHAWALGSKRH